MKHSPTSRHFLIVLNMLTNLPKKDYKSLSAQILSMHNCHYNLNCLHRTPLAFAADIDTDQLSLSVAGIDSAVRQDRHSPALTR